MAIRLLTDFHHSSLLRATNMLFGDRLHMMVYRPLGLEWFDEGFWAINDQRDTAEQFLSLDQSLKPGDNTPPLNRTITRERDEILGETPANGVYYVSDPGGLTAHRAATLEFFKNNRFDYVIASIPAHVPLFERLIAEYMPMAKLIVQIGNEWPEHLFAGHNVLASVKPRAYGPDTNAIFYHQEFDTEIFRCEPSQQTTNVYSFINILQDMRLAWSDFEALGRILPSFNFRSYGGQCRDGNMTGPQQLADKMREAGFIFHVKEGGDGFGHILYNAYAVGRPVIIRRRFYRDRLAEELFEQGTYIDLDEYTISEAADIIADLSSKPDELERMGKAAHRQFHKVVNYEKEAEEISEWLNLL